MREQLAGRPRLRRLITSVVDVALVGSVLALAAALVFRPEVRRQPARTLEVSATQRRDLARSPWSFGPAAAPFRVTVWTDYQCPACKRFEYELGELRARLGDSVHIVIRHMPLTTSHPLAFQAAVAAECGRRQGRFPETHAALFGLALTDSIPLGRLIAASEIADESEFMECLRNDEIAKQIGEEMRLVADLGLRATPSVLIGSTIQSGGMTSELLEERLRAAGR